MNIQEFFDTYRPIINKKLSDYVTFNCHDNRKELESAIQYAVNAKAKRIRPLLTIATHQMFTDDIQKIMPIACAIELVHTYSLIHDDLPAMDDDDLRRGQATTHIKYGEDTAILAGDVLNTFAFELLANDLPHYYSDTQTLHAIKTLAISFGINGMAGGQILDLKGTQDQDANYLEQTHKLKTGAILKECISLPAYLENADHDTQRTCTQIGEKVGLLFQIVDDILDVKGSKEELGKSPQKDIEQNKLTYVTRWGLDKAQQIAKSTADEATSLLQTLSMDSTILKNIVSTILTRSD